MNKTHFEVVEDADMRLADALITQNLPALLNLLHPDVIYTSAHGEVFIGAKNVPAYNPGVYRIDTLETLERRISFFNNVAVVTAIEKREGEFLSLPFRGLYSTTRTWKFNRQWQMISATSVMI